jgi:hypothetical protein
MAAQQQHNIVLTSSSRRSPAQVLIQDPNQAARHRRTTPGFESLHLGHTFCTSSQVIMSAAPTIMRLLAFACKTAVTDTASE